MTGAAQGTAVAIAMDMTEGIVARFRPTAGPVEWIEAIGVIATTSLALTWLSVALGMVSKSVETAGNLPMFSTSVAASTPSRIPPQIGLTVLAWLQPGDLA